MRKFRKIVSLLLTMAVTITLLPLNTIRALAAGPVVVDEVYIGITYNSDLNLKENYLMIKGSGLQGASVAFIINGKMVILTKRDINIDGVQQFTIDPGQLGDSLYVDGYGTIPVGISKMPTLSGISPYLLENGAGNLTITGRNFNNIDTTTPEGNKYTARYGKGLNFVDIHNPTNVTNDTTIQLNNPTGTPGLNDVVFQNNATQSVTMQAGGSHDTKVSVFFTYSDIFRLYNKLNIGTDFTMYPNSGVGGASLYFQQTNTLQNMDIFFLKTLDGSDHFTSGNKLKHELPVKLQDQNNNDYYKITATVPDLSPGEYYVVLTNVIPDGVDPQTGVSSQYVMPEKYIIINGTNALNIYNITPNKGPDTGANAEITGNSIGSLNIDGLTTSSVPDSVYSDSSNKLIIQYPDGTFKVGSITYDVHIQKNILVIIGQSARFATDSGGNIIGYDFSNPLNRITVIPKISNISEDTVKDVTIQTETVLTIKGGTNDGKVYSFTEQAVLPNGYTFSPSSRIPVINTVSPDKIQIEDTGASGFQTKNDTALVITGDKFMVYRDTGPDGKPIIRYPIIRITDNGIQEIEIDKTHDEINNVLYSEVDVTVLDKDGNIIDGSEGKQQGTKIIVTIPKGCPVSEPKPNPAPKSIEIINPVKNADSNGFIAVAKDIIDFVITENSPVIESVTPNVVTVDGGENITILGSNFQGGVKVFIAGEEVKGVTRDGDGKKLAFKAAKGREGLTQLMVMNSDGGAAVYPFIYVKTYTDPKITGFSPNKGSTGTLVLVNGDNFVKPDPTVPNLKGINIFKLIGTRILLEGKDINRYYYMPDNLTIGLQDYSAPAGNLLIKNNAGVIAAADYYYSVILEEDTGHYFTLDVDPKGNVILSDGASEKYTIKPSGNNITAVGDTGTTYYVIVNQGDITLTDNIASPTVTRKLSIKTPYEVTQDAFNNMIITGNRTKVLSKNQIIFTVPMLDVEQWYDVSVVNPDTKTDTKADQQGFYYFKLPQMNPVITSITPNQGSTDGGYYVTIQGTGFKDNSTDKSKVYVGGVEVPAADTIVGTDGNTITVKMPKYPRDVRTETGTDHKTVPVVIINPDGGNASKPDGFTYMIPTSHPKINKILPNRANAAGGDIIQIWGDDFRYFEPYTDANGNAAHAPSEAYQDLSANGQWDNITGRSINGLTAGEKKILPKIYFGSHQADIIDFADGYITVYAPAAEKGNVEVYIVNNDFGVSNKVSFIFDASNPKIDKIVPNIGKKQGNDEVDFFGSDFRQGSVQVYDQYLPGGILLPTEKNLAIIQFGSSSDPYISNRSIPPLRLNAGNIINGITTVNVGDLKVDYDATSGSRIVTFTVQNGSRSYSGIIDNYDDSVVYVPLHELRDQATGVAYPGYELVRIQVQSLERRLLVDRSFAPQVDYISSDHIIVHTPSYYTVGKVTVTLTNPDNGQATGQFEYKNPASHPLITNITKEGQLPEQTTVNGQTVNVLKMSYKGGNIISVIGQDFRDGAKILIGDVASITPDKITYSLPNRLTFEMPAVPETIVGELCRVVVVNDDGGMSSSSDLNPPIYIIFTKGETSPGITKITPDKGPSGGGTTVKIEGSDFRATMAGIDRRIAVYFGEFKVPDSNVTVTDYKTIYVVTPAGAPGKVTVRVENPDGELSGSGIVFTYISSPKVTAVVDPTDPSEHIRISTISVEGGQEIKLKGSGFMDGVKVVFNPVIKKVSDITTATGQVIYIGGQAYTLESGNDGTDAKIIDSETVTVTTPKGKNGTSGILVINPDGGASDIFNDLIYGLPALNAPTGVQAELVYDRYIKVHWNNVDKAKEYEIYVVIGGSEIDLVGSTKLNSYVYTDLDPDTDYKFIVKAIGDFGSSAPSAESNTVTTGSKVGPPDNDGKLTDKTTMVKSGSTANVSIGEKDSDDGPITIDLTRGALAGCKEVVVSIPASVVSSRYADNIIILGKDFRIEFNPSVFDSSRIENNRSRYDAGVRFKVSTYAGSSELLSDGGTSLSTQYILEADIYVGKDFTKMDYTDSNFNITLDYDTAKAQMRRLGDITLNRYDSYGSKWVAAGSAGIYDSAVSASVNRLGRYMVIGRRG